MNHIESFDNIRDALTDIVDEDANIQTKAELMRQIVKTNWTQSESAKHWVLPHIQPKLAMR